MVQGFDANYCQNEDEQPTWQRVNRLRRRLTQYSSARRDSGHTHPTVTTKLIFPTLSQKNTIEKLPQQIGLTILVFVEKHVPLTAT